MLLQERVRVVGAGVPSLPPYSTGREENWLFVDLMSVLKTYLQLSADPAIAASIAAISASVVRAHAVP